MKYTVFLDGKQIQDFIINGEVEDTTEETIEEPVVEHIVEKEPEVPLIETTQIEKPVSTPTQIEKSVSTPTQKPNIFIPNNVKQFMNTTQSSDYTKYIMIVAGVLMLKKIF